MGVMGVKGWGGEDETLALKDAFPPRARQAAHLAPADSAVVPAEVVLQTVGGHGAELGVVLELASVHASLGGEVVEVDLVPVW